MIRVEKERRVAADLEEVRSFAGNFFEIARWHPSVSEVRRQEDTRGTSRLLLLADGAELLERRLDNAKVAGLYTYTIVRGPMPVNDYTSTFEIAEDDGGVFIKWSGQFLSTTTDEEATKMISGIYEDGLQSIQEHFK
ncbi:hypothetical protein GFB49_19270 [Epibacterium sp. SM1979]|uniref:Polyketide cyclase / dehydrase and lipid transport n=1 Tax=Tritonibacter litoralis TaxID=2662264 RepID=A0A843YGF8_9RHOB|nr:SRPBCC family protein [Tritonibacter litoralis]MQQ10600.1 hypothetical protein [Tritonibacter litoralis]